MDEDERRAKHAAYMRQWYAKPENQEKARLRAQKRYRENRDRILDARRQKTGAGPRRRRWTTDEVLQAIRELSVDGVAKCPTSGSLPGIAANRFGSWAAACESAGLVSAWRQPLRSTAKYSTVHSRLVRERGKPNKCEDCGATSDDRRYEWALNLHVENPKFNEKGHPYSVDLADYRRLCKSCHVLQDQQRATTLTA